MINEPVSTLRRSLVICCRVSVNVLLMTWMVSQNILIKFAERVSDCVDDKIRFRKLLSRGKDVPDITRMGRIG